MLRTMEALSGGLLFTALIGAGLGGSTPGQPPGPTRTPPPATAGTPADNIPAPRSGQPTDAHAPLAPSTPLTIAVPSIALAAPLLSLGTDRAGEPELPPFPVAR